MASDPATVLSHFSVGDVTSVTRSGAGHINDTYLVETATGRYILQRINSAVFPDADALMGNFARVTAHLRAESSKTLEIIPTHDGSRVYRDYTGSAWRLLPYIENTFTATATPTSEQAEAAAAAFGAFSRSLSDLPAPRLHETIPEFHDTPRRFRDFISAVETDPMDRTAGSRAEIDAILSREPWCNTIANAMADGSVPERIAHNDAKLDNILFDAETDLPVCVIDLDTVMPGCVLHDFGDLVRSAAATAAEDEADLSRVGISAPIYQALNIGFLRGCGDILTAREREFLPFAGKAITYEQAIRFLADHLLGDPYYKTSRPNHNLDRARNQLRLLDTLDSLEA